MRLHCIHISRHAALTVLLGLSFFVAGCASVPPEQFYTLTGGVAAVDAAGDAATVAPVVPMYVEIGPVSVPLQVSRTQLVVRSDSDSGVNILEQQRWAGPLAGEIGQALSLGITSRVGAIDVYRTPYPEEIAVYRVSTNVQRFESAPGQYALIDAVWSVRPPGNGTVLTCRTVARESVGTGTDALVTGHRRAVGQIAAGIAGVIRRMAGGMTTGCPAA